MILEFTAKNFLSIKDEVTLSMVASKDPAYEDNLLSYTDGKKEKKALKTAVIYGANASGKTNILKAMKFMSWFVSESHNMQQGRKIPVESFKLSKETINEPSEFNIIFTHEEIKYQYGFAATVNEVFEEYLYYYPNGRQSLIFERENVTDYKFTVDVEKQMEIKRKFDSPNKLFLSTLSLWEYERAKPAFDWFNNYLDIFIDHEGLEVLTGKIMDEDDEFASLVKKYIRYADMDIDNIDVEINEGDEILTSKMFQVLPDKEQNRIKVDIQGKKLIKINTIHNILDEDGNITMSAEFSLGDESDGTQKFFGILGQWIHALITGSTIVIDELDIRLHTLLVKKLVDMFMNSNINKNNAQLIFSTHDTNLLDSNIFRRDQIYFTEKKEDKSTDLYSLYDFRGVRNSANIEKGYLQGKYGAIPVLKGEWIWD